jgi:hypothetical protein
LYVPALATTTRLNGDPSETPVASSVVSNTMGVAVSSPMFWSALAVKTP